MCLSLFSQKYFSKHEKIGYKEIVGDPVFDVYEDKGLIQMEYWVDDDQVQENVDEVCLHVVENLQLEPTKDIHINNKVDERSYNLLESLDAESYEKINEIEVWNNYVRWFEKIYQWIKKKKKNEIKTMVKIWGKSSSIRKKMM